MPVSPAGLSRRIAAFGLDYLLMLAYIALLVAISLIVIGWPPKGPFLSPERYDLRAFLVLVLPVILYFALMEASARQATWGKRRMGLKVVSTGGARLSLGRSLVRSAAKFVPWQIAHTCLFQLKGMEYGYATNLSLVDAGFLVAMGLVAAYLVTLARPPHRTPYDRLAGSLVTRG